MNKQQLQTYFNPIQELLNCPQGEETAILQQNDGLSNQEFIPVVKQYADLWQKQETESNNAAWLSNIPQTLTEYLKGKGNKIQDYLNFLQQALQAEIESNNNPAVVYPILQQHQHLLDDVFAQLLPQWLKNTVSQMNPEEATAIVEVIENLCIDINEFPLGSRANNLEIAIKGYETVLEMRPRATMAEQWAMTQNNLGNAYRGRIRGERAQNIEHAIEAYEQSLQVRTPTAFPIDCLQTGRNLGNIGKAEKDWETAMKGYGQAIAGVEQSRDWAITQYSKKEILGDAIGVYHGMIEVCYQAGQLDRAFTTVESNKSRYLVELLAATTVNIPDTATDDQRQVYQAYQQLRRRLDISGLQSGNSEELNSERLQLNELLNEIKGFDPNFAVTQKVERIKLSEIQSILDPKTVIWEWYISDDKFYCFVITENSIDVVISNEQQLEQLKDWSNGYFDSYVQENWNTLPEKLGYFWETLLLPQVLEKTPKHCDKLILIPHQYLHIFPIHAVYNPENNLSLAETFKQGIQYSPSCQLLQKIEEKSRQREEPKPLFFGIQNPTEDLFYGGLEVEIIAESFKPDTFVLKEKEASKTKLLEVNNIQQLRRSRYLHFSCHGSFNLDSPLDSFLLLAGETDKDRLNEQELETFKNEGFLKDEKGVIKPIQKLTLEDIFEKINLPQCELVILSACRTGLTGLSKGVDEYIGLGSGFLYAGSLHVINSLWSVGEFSTAILMIRFYQLMFDKNNPVSIHLAL